MKKIEQIVFLAFVLIINSLTPTSQVVSKDVSSHSFNFFHGLRFSSFNFQQENPAKIQQAKEDKIIQAHLEKYKIKAQKTKSGLYYVIENQGKGIKPKTKQGVIVHYTGMLLNGKAIDSSKGKKPISFSLNTGRMIQGFNEGIALLNEGGIATLYIPSHLGYGTAGLTPIVPANSILVFKVELLEVTK
jgi:FKBP-type peptidyl-prolyl cis-trans isomerase